MSLQLISPHIQLPLEYYQCIKKLHNSNQLLKTEQLIQINHWGLD